MECKYGLAWMHWTSCQYVFNYCTCNCGENNCVVVRKKNMLFYNNDDDISLLQCDIIDHALKIKRMNESYKIEKGKRKNIVKEYRDCVKKVRK